MLNIPSEIKITKLKQIEKQNKDVSSKCNINRWYCHLIINVLKSEWLVCMHN